MSKSLKASDIVIHRPKPSLYLNSKDLPAIKNWQVGKTYTLTVKVKMSRLSQRDTDMDEDLYDNDSGKYSADLRVVDIKEK